MEPTKQFTNDCIDTPDIRDYPYEQYKEEFAQWETRRPYKKITLFNQWLKPYCTRYWLRHIINAQNINEYIDNWLEYIQVNPDTDRETWSKIKTIQSSMSDARKRWDIEMNFIIKKDSNMIANIRDALSKGMYIFTGSNNWYWSRIKRTFNYEIIPWRTDIWHAFAIIEDIPEKQQFKAVNSYWTKRADWWYFYIDYDMIPWLYTLNAIKDKVDTDKFNRIKNRENAKEIVRILKKMNYNWADWTRCKTQADYLRKTYSFTDDDL